MAHPVVREAFLPSMVKSPSTNARSSWWRFPIIAFAVSRLLDAVVIVVSGAAQRSTFTSPAPGYFIFNRMHQSPGYLGVITNWDGQWYQAIATLGYQAAPSSGMSVQDTDWAWAFPPGFPLTAALVMRLTGSSFAVSASVLNLVAGALAMVVLYRLLLGAGGLAAARAGVLMTCCFVTAPLLQAAYSEALGLLFLLLALYCIRERMYFVALIPTTALALTRLITPALILVVVVHAWQRKREEGTLPRRDLVGLATLAAASAAGAVLWLSVVAVLRGPDVAFRRTSGMTPHRFGWFSQSYQEAGLGAPLLIALGMAFLLALTWTTRGEAMGTELRTWTWAYPLFLLTATTIHTGILRYLLLAPAAGVLVLGIKPGAERLTRAQTWLLSGCLVLGALSQVWFIRDALVLGTTLVMP